MILYHGSNQLITKIDLSKSKNFKDFGRGFYLTKDYARAVAMAQRTTAIMGDGSPEVSPFIFNPSRCPSDVRIKIFDGRTAEWALFVLKNREKDPAQLMCNFADVNKNLSMDIGEGDRDSKRLQAVNHHGLAGGGTCLYLCLTLYPSKR